MYNKKKVKKYRKFIFKKNHHKIIAATDPIVPGATGEYPKQKKVVNILANENILY